MVYSYFPKESKAKALSQRGHHRQSRCRALYFVTIVGGHSAVGGHSWNACAKNMSSTTSALQSSLGLCYF